MQVSVSTIVGTIGVMLFASAPAVAQQQWGQKTATARSAATTPAPASEQTPTDVLSSDEWRRVDAAVNRALEWLANQQRSDGAFPTLETGQPGVTCLSM